MIIVTGGSGQLGTAVARHLRRLSHETFITTARKPQEPGQRRADFDDPASCREAFRGGKRLLLVSSSGIDHDKRLQRHKNAIDAAKKAGVKHVYYTSLAPAGVSKAAVMSAHRDTERYLATSGLPFTVLANGVYVEAWRTYLGDLEGDVVKIPGDGPVAWVGRDDLAEGTARLLLEGGRQGERLELTGPEALDCAALCKIASQTLGREIRREIVPVENPSAWDSTYSSMEKGDFARLDPLLEQLLGRPRRAVKELLPSLLKV